MQDYRQLRVHANAHALAVAVRAATRRFPRNGYASLKGQMTTAAESISFNIVEGCGADSQKEFARFLLIGIRSANELENQLKLAKDYGLLTTLDWESLTESTVDVRRMLYGLRTKVRETFSSGTASTQKRTTQKRSTQTAKSNSVDRPAL
ncbi:MAG: four helix bundle protein [Anaerolineae bacterium]|nr:four helix bundle protein [Gemmatimonadaceae bacterium]